MEDKYIIMPTHPWWKVENYSGSKQMEEGSVYSSDANEKWLSVEELSRLADGEE
jgi:hypothetical protein